jgi:hypothetical protein
MTKTDLILLPQRRHLRAVGRQPCKEQPWWAYWHYTVHGHDIPLHSSLNNRTAFRIKCNPISPSAQAQYSSGKDTHTLIPSAFVREVTIGIVQGREVDNDIVFVWYRGERKAVGILLKPVSVCCIRLTRDCLPRGFQMVYPWMHRNGKQIRPREEEWEELERGIGSM